MIGSWYPSIPGHRVNQGRHVNPCLFVRAKATREREGERDVVLYIITIPVREFIETDEHAWRGGGRARLAWIKYAYPTHERKRTAHEKARLGKVERILSAPLIFFLERKDFPSLREFFARFFKRFTRRPSTYELEITRNCCSFTLPMNSPLLPPPCFSSINNLNLDPWFKKIRERGGIPGEILAGWWRWNSILRLAEV